MRSVQSVQFVRNEQRAQACKSYGARAEHKRADREERARSAKCVHREQTLQVAKSVRKAKSVQIIRGVHRA